MAIKTANPCILWRLFQTKLPSESAIHEEGTKMKKMISMIISIIISPKIYIKNMQYDSDRNTVPFTDEQEVGKEQKYEIIVWSDETTPCRYMLILR